MFAYDPASGRWSYPEHYLVVDRGLLPSGVTKHFGTPTRDDVFGTVHVLQFDFDGPIFATNVQAECAAMAERNVRCLPVRGQIDLLPLRTLPLRLWVPRGHYRVAPQPETGNAWIARIGEHVHEVRVDDPTELEIGADGPLTHLRIEAD
jgi:hypothetical protein